MSYRNLKQRIKGEDRRDIYGKSKGENVFELSKNNQKILEVSRDGCGVFTFKAQNAFMSKHKDKLTSAKNLTQQCRIRHLT